MFKVTFLMLFSSFIAGSDKAYVVLERGDVRAVIVNNEAVDDEVLPGQRYRFVMRAMYLPFKSRQQIIRATARHRAALER